MSKKIITYIFFISLFFINSFAFDGDYGTESIFMTGFGARPDAMGGAYSALSDDLSSILYNPAGIGFINKQSIYLLYYPLYENTGYSAAAYCFPVLDFGNIAGAFVKFSSGYIQGYDIYDKENSQISVDEYKLNVTYARNIGNNIFAGIGVNIFTFNISDFTATGFGADIGFLYEPFSFVRMAFVLHNFIKPNFSMMETKEGLPQRYTIGLLGKYTINNFIFYITSDFFTGENQNFKYKLGVEINWMKIFSVRAGFDDGYITSGGGISLFDMNIDYACILNDFLGPLHRFSFSYNFGMTLTEQREENKKAILREVKKLVEERFNKKVKEKANEYYKKSYAAYNRGDYETALIEAQRAIEWDETNQNALKMKNFLEKRLKEEFYKETKTSKMIEDNPHITAGISYYIKKQYYRALQELEMALKENEDNKIVLLYINKVKEKIQKQDKKIIKTLEEQEQLDKMYYLGINAYTEGDIEKAILLWEKILKMDPENVKVLRNLEKAQAELEELKKRGIK